MTTTRVLAGLVSNGNILADGVITPAEIGIISISGVTYPGDDQAANPAGGQTITVNGTGFASTPTVYVGGVIAPSVSFISSTQITFTSPAKVAGTYDIYVVNPSGSTAIRVYGISYSGTPTWTTAAGELGPVDASFTIQLVATGDAPLTYALTSGSTLPSGVTLSSAGLITGSALTVEQTFNFSVDAIDAQLQETPRSFAVTVSLADAYFKYVTMLLTGDPVVTPFNSDASTNGFNVAINGDARSDNFTPYQGDGYYSNYFAGGSNYLDFPSNAAYGMGTGDFTIEAWLYPINPWTGAGSYNPIFLVSGTGGLYFGQNSAGFGLRQSGTANIISYGTSPTLNTWTHVAIVRSGTTVTMYYNGTSVATATSSANFTSGTLTIGWDGSYGIPAQYISNLRIVKGTAVYTSAFTPSTTPLTAISGTSLLTCQSNRLIDTSSNSATATPTGTPSVKSAQPFTLPSSVATYGSGYFGGSGGYLLTPSTGQFAPSGDFTISLWYYPTSLANYYSLIGNYTTNASTDWLIEIWANGTIKFYLDGGTARITSSSGAITIGQWHYISLNRSGTTVTAYVNGTSQGTYTLSGTFGTTSKAINIAGAVGDYTYGYISDVKLINGSSVTTVPTVPQTATTGTSLLTAQYNGGGNNSGFKDSSLNDFPITRAGNTTQGTFTPYGSGWSNYFDGTGDYLVNTAASSAFAFAQGDLTFEAWVYPTVTAGQQYRGILSTYDGSVGNGNGLILEIFNQSWGYYAINGGTHVSSGVTAPLNTWTHVALVRQSGTLKLYANGVQIASGSDTTNCTASPFQVGEISNAGGYPFCGYISNARIVKGTAVYTSNFTPSTTPLTAISGTSLLTCQSNRFIDNSSNAFAITRNGDTSVQRFNPFPPGAVYTAASRGGSAYFDGSGDYLTAPSASGQLGSGDFTVEAYIYPVSRVSLYPTIWGNYNSYTTGALGIFAGHNGGNTSKYQVSVNGAAFPTIQSTDSIVYNQWTHIAVVRSSGVITLYVNGVANGTYSISTALNGANTTWIGTSGDELINGCFNGYISNSRVVKGTAIYTTAFTPPTAPLTAVTNTQLLLSYTNAGIFDNAMISDLETIGNAQISTSVKKFGTGSIAMLTSSDYCRGTQPSTVGDINGGDFTIEFWVYFTSVAANRGLISKYGNTAENAGGLGYVVQFQQSIPSLRFVLGIGGGVDAVYDFAWSPSVATWYHVAITRSGTSGRAFINGIQIGSTTTVTVSDLASPNPPQIGKTHTAAQYLLGYMDDIRVTKGVARYTANFTPPTAAFKTK